MNLAKEHDRKGLVATILIHLIVLLLLMMVIPEIKESMMDDAGMVQVSFGELDGGGPENTNSVSEPQSNPEPTQQQSNPTPNPTPTPDNPVVTNDDAEAEVKNDAPKQTQKTQEEKEVEKEAPKVNDRLKDRLDALKNRQKTGDDNSSSGPGKDGPKGDPNSDKSGPGGNDPTGNDNTGGGRYGSNINHSLFGFGIESAPKFQNPTNKRGYVTVELCVDGEGNVIPGSVKRSLKSKVTDTELVNFTISQVRRMKFKKLGNVASDRNCGSVTIKYSQK
jgi:hypothetical protein